MEKFARVTKEINGVKYTAQFNGIKAALEGVDNCYIKGTNQTSSVKVAEYLLKNVLIEPKKEDIDDFTDIEEFNEVISFLTDVSNGTFREETVEVKAKAKSSR